MLVLFRAFRSFVRSDASLRSTEMSAELGFPLRVCSSAADVCGGADVIFTSTPGSSLVLEKAWLQPHATVIAAGSDRP